MKSFTFLCLPFEKKCMKFENLFRYRGQAPDTRTTKTCSSEKISQKQSTTMAPEQASIRFDNNSHAFKASDQHRLSRWSPRKPFKSKAAMFNQTNRRRKEHFSVVVFWGRGLGSGMRSNSPAYVTEALALFLPRTTLYGGRFRFLRTIITP